jgi:P27 family predicted phage terminase small subunit
VTALPAGRPRKPTAEHLMNGNPSKIKDLEQRYAQEPTFDLYTPSTVPDPPDFMPDLAKECWRENAPLLAAQRLFTKADAEALMVFCITYWAWRKCVEDAVKVGALVYKPHAKTQPGSTYLDMLPQVRGMLQFGKALLDSAREFGKTPSARGRMVSPEAKQEEDEMMQLLRKVK